METEYYIYKFDFQGYVHFGGGSLDRSETSFCADTLFSALCQEAVRSGENELDQLVRSTQAGDILLSDAFPYIRNEYFIPKPFIHVESRQNNGDSVVKKIYKKMEYIPASLLSKFVSGEFPLDRAEDISVLGSHSTFTRASIRGQEETLPYRVGAYRFNEGCGLYIIAAFGSRESRELFENLMDGVSMSGIGGKRSSGFGRFVMHRERIQGDLLKRLTGSYQTYMALSVALPVEEELPAVLEGAHYMIQKRSGFVSSVNYSDEYMRKRDLYVFKAGSCFLTRFGGDVYDVSSGGAHPVFRYAKPVMLGVVR